VNISAITNVGAVEPQTSVSFSKAFAQAKGRHQPTTTSMAQPHKAEVMLHSVAEAQARLEKVLDAARSGKTFSAAQLLALQADAYRATQELDLAGKVVEKGAGGVKQILQTQV
jgi:hypothetical protein